MRKAFLYGVALFIVHAYVVAEYKVFTITLNNKNIVDVYQLEPKKDQNIFASLKPLYVETFCDTYEPYTSEQLYVHNKSDIKGVIEAVFESEKTNFCGRNNITVFFAKEAESNKAIGLIIHEMVQDADFIRRVYIRQLVIDKRYQGQGLGKKFVFQTLDVLTENNPAIVTVCTRKINPAVHFYKKLGFVDVPMCEVDPDLPEYKWHGFMMKINNAND